MILGKCYLLDYIFCRTLYNFAVNISYLVFKMLRNL